MILLYYFFIIIMSLRCLVRMPTVCLCRIHRPLHGKRLKIYQERYSHSNISEKELQTAQQRVSSNKNLASLNYTDFRDEHTELILDIYEERLKYSSLLEQDTEKESRFTGLNLEHGVAGVFDIEDLVVTLNRENVEDLFVASVPKEIKYVDHIVIVNGKSSKHMQAIAQFVRRVYKQKRSSSDIIPKIEGEHSKDWIAIDLGNIALHIFSKKARALYDLDSLWAVGPRYDNECNKKEPISEMLEKHSIYLAGLEPAT